MAGIPTEHLADQIRETNQRLTESHDRLSDEIHDLNHKFDDLNHKFDDFRVEIAEKLGAINANLEIKLGAINANLEGFRGRAETSFKVAVWGITVASTVALAVIGAVMAGTWYAAKLDSRVERVESRLDKEFPPVPAPKRP